MGLNLGSLLKKLFKKSITSGDVKKYLKEQNADMIEFYRIVYKEIGVTELILDPARLAYYALMGIIFCALHGKPTPERVKAFLQDLK
jgi:hypothetical protein